MQLTLNTSAVQCGCLAPTGLVVLSVVDSLCSLIPTDLPVKMVTGTIALQVGDVNDNCPSLTSNMKAVCSDTQIINVTAVDVDGDPNAAPFNFSIVTEKSQGEWRLEPLNGMVPYLYYYLFYLNIDALEP